MMPKVMSGRSQCTNTRTIFLEAFTVFLRVPGQFFPACERNLTQFPRSFRRRSAPRDRAVAPAT